MALILGLETSSKNCSVSLIRNGEVLVSKESADGYQHSEKLHPFIDEVFAKTSHRLKDLDALILGHGPGSFTGLRIGTSAAKGFCFTLSIPLMTYSSLANMALQVNNKLKEASTPAAYLLCSLVDARRMEVYSAVFDNEMEEIHEAKAMVIDEHSFGSLLEQSAVYFFGDGMNKIKPLIENHNNAYFIDNVLPTSIIFNEVGEKIFKSENFEDTAYYEPFYLKGVHLTSPKKQV